MTRRDEQRTRQVQSQIQSQVESHQCETNLARWEEKDDTLVKDVPRECIQLRCEHQLDLQNLLKTYEDLPHSLKKDFVKAFETLNRKEEENAAGKQSTEQDLLPNVESTKENRHINLLVGEISLTDLTRDWNVEVERKDSWETVYSSEIFQDSAKQ